MILNNFVQRANNARTRPADAFRRWRRRFILRLSGIDLSKQTELQYMEFAKLSSKILSKKLISGAEEISLGKTKEFRHNFNSKFQFTISNALVNTQNNLIYLQKQHSKEYLLLKESSEWPADRNLVTSETPPKNIQKVVDYARIGLSSVGFFHLITEDLVGLLFGESKAPVLNYVGNSELVSQILVNLDVEILTVPKWVAVKELIFVSRGDDLGYLNPFVLGELEKFAYNIASDSKNVKNIYVSRIRSRRSFKEEQEIADFLAEKDFEIVKAENYSFSDQVKIFRNAKIIVGLHGAGLTHGIWSHDSSIIEIMPDSRVNRCYEWQTLLTGNQYERITYSSSSPDISSIIARLDFLIR
jgi:hypothetical protein